MESKKKKILVLGSGMMVEPLIDHLLKNELNHVMIGTNMLESAKKLIEKKKNSRLAAEELDVMDESKLKELIRKSHLVVSYVPPFLHERVGKACLAEKKHMITTSYISEALMKLDPEVKKSGLIFMNEIGLDPGIDHLITHKVIHEAEKHGDKIISYESWCGALPSPEFIDNPLLYKFTWAPRGALLALKNEATQLINAKILKVPSNELLVKTTNKNFHSCFKFEGYYNRDSLQYKELYNLKDAETVIRGTIRFKGFAFIFQSFKNLGLFDDTQISESIENWRNYFYQHLLNQKANKETISKIENQFIKPVDNLFLDATKDKNFKAENTFYYELSLLALSKFSEEYIKENGGFVDLFKKLYASLRYLDLYDDSNKVIG
jgi:saccharopine dehydrogenase-like NADP-dependent oxidoreductase